MTDPMSPEELRACRERAEAALPGSRLRRLLATIAALESDLFRIADALGRVQYPDGHAPYRGSADEVIARAEELTRAENTRGDAIAALSEHRHAALLAAGIRGGPGAWRWASDPTGTILDDVAAWERLLGEMRERASPTTAIYCPNCEATGFPPAGHSWPGLEPWWIDGAKLCCTECGACLVVRADGERASLELDEPEPAERRPAAGWRLVDGRLELSVGCEPHAHGQMTAHVGEVEGEHFYEIEVDDIEGSLHEFAWGGRFATPEASQFAAEDALFALADAINALRGGKP